jgi:hypothetical protein
MVHRRNLRVGHYAVIVPPGAFAHQRRFAGGLRHWHGERTVSQLPTGRHHNCLHTARLVEATIDPGMSYGYHPRNPRQNFASEVDHVKARGFFYTSLGSSVSRHH